jgi:hypothetical protein
VPAGALALGRHGQQPGFSGIPRPDTARPRALPATGVKEN